jgi:hypothetical protein
MLRAQFAQHLLIALADLSAGLGSPSTPCTPHKKTATPKDRRLDKKSPIVEFSD